MSFIITLVFVFVIFIVNFVVGCIDCIVFIGNLLFGILGLKRGHPSEQLSKTGQIVYLNGLANLGNTCFMNSSLQVLYSIKEFKEYVINTKCLKPIHQKISGLFKTMNTDLQRKPLKPEEFLKTFCELNPEFGDRQQHDAHEFLRFLIDYIHEEFKETKNKLGFSDDPLSKLFEGKFKSIIECTECMNQKHNSEEFWDISLALPQTESEEDCNLEDCLKSYTNSEILETKSECNQCKQMTQFSKKLKFESLPNVLTIQLKKFGNNGQKISKNVNISQKLKIKEIDYHLMAFISHRGSRSSSGHYTSHCKHFGKWFRFDDYKIDEMPDIKSRDISAAYILFYQKQK